MKSGAELIKTVVGLKLFGKYLICLTLFTAACDSEEPMRQADDGRDYFPLKTGMYSLFDVTETTYTPGQQPQTAAYEILTEIIDSFPNADDSFTYIIRRMKRVPGGAWESIDTWSTRMGDHQQGVVNEGNIPYVKLQFPLDDGVRWDGNRENNLGADEYRVLSLDTPMEINGQTFGKTVTIEQENYDDEVTLTDIRKEVYARGVGLVAREITKLNYCTSQVCLGDGIIESGIVYLQLIRENGIH